MEEGSILNSAYQINISINQSKKLILFKEIGQQYKAK